MGVIPFSRAFCVLNPALRVCPDVKCVLEFFSECTPKLCVLSLAAYGSLPG